MTEADFPALYLSADSASIATQRQYLRCIKWYGFLSVAGAALATYGVDSRAAAFLAALLFLGGLFLSILMAVRKYEDSWYRSRAVAESVKTASWRFMMGAEPFKYDIAVQDARAKLSRLLAEVLNEHKHLGPELAGASASKPPITETMLATRARPLPERIAVYKRARIDEQRTWYANKSETNKVQGNLWFGTLIVLQAAAIVCSLLRVSTPEYKFWPIEVFAVAAASVLGWIQVKRFRELAASYAVTAHEIGLASEDLPDVPTDETFAQFVENTEKAFSREHTQWVARKDAAA